MHDDDRELFRKALRDVKPLRGKPRVTFRPPPPPPRPAQSRADARAALAESLAANPEDSELETGEHLWYAAPGVPQTTLRRLRRGRYRVQAELDLHGLNAAAARRAVAAFLNESAAADLRCLRIIHGKGLGSGTPGPVLKRRLGGWLRRRAEVAAYCSARPADGGTGAVYVLLRGK